MSTARRARGGRPTARARSSACRSGRVAGRFCPAHPGYITWEQYQSNRRTLRNNSRAHAADRRHPPREGPALLQGLAVCGLCGKPMTIRYHARQGRLVPDYVCQREGIQKGEPICQSIRGGGIDQAIGEILLEHVAADDARGLPGGAARTAESPRRERPPAKAACRTARYEADKRTPPVHESRSATIAWSPMHWKPNGTKSCVPWRKLRSSTSSSGRRTGRRRRREPGPRSLVVDRLPATVERSRHIASGPQANGAAPDRRRHPDSTARRSPCTSASREEPRRRGGCLRRCRRAGPGRPIRKSSP